TSVGQAVTLSNTGTALLTISAISSSGDFAETNTCGSSVAAGASCTISVTFKPTALGSRAGSLTATDNNNEASGSVQTVSLAGVGVVPAASLSASSLTFTHRPSSTTSVAQAVTLSNTGTGPLTISAISSSGDFAQTNTCGGSV